MNSKASVDLKMICTFTLVYDVSGRGSINSSEQLV